MRPKPIDFYVIPQSPLDFTVGDMDRLWNAITAEDDRAKYGDTLEFKPHLDTDYVFRLNTIYDFQIAALYAPSMEFRSNNRVEIDDIVATSINEGRMPKSQVETINQRWLELDYTIRIGTLNLRNVGENRFLYLVALVMTKLVQGYTLVTDSIFFLPPPGGLCSYDRLLKVWTAYG